MNGWGVSPYYAAADPAALLYKACVAGARPASIQKNLDGYVPGTWTAAGYTGLAGGIGGSWDIFCEMCLRSRSLFYCEQTVGDCGISFAAPSEGTGAVIGDQAATALISALSPIPIPGLGAVISDVTGLLSGEDHQIAVSKEKSVLCQLASTIGGAIQRVYQGYYGGQLTGAQAYANVQQLATTFHGSYFEAGGKIKACNAGCGMDAIMTAHVALAGYLFQQTPLPPGVSIAFPATSTEIQPGLTPLIAETVVGSVEENPEETTVAASASGSSLGIVLLVVIGLVLYMVTK